MRPTRMLKKNRNLFRTRNVTLCDPIICLDESFRFLSRSCPSGGVIQRVAGSGRGRTHLRDGERGCLPERCCAPQNIWTPLHLAAVCGRAAVVEPLLTAGASVDATDKVRGGGGADRGGLGGSTPLCVFSLFSCFLLLIIGLKLKSRKS